MKKRLSSRTIPWFLITIFLFLVAGIFITGFLFYQKQREHIKIEAQNNLAAIADLKVGQITRWRQERMIDAKLVYNNAAIARQVDAYFKTPEKIGPKQDLLKLMKSFQEHAGYRSILLLDTKRNVRLSVSNHDDSVCSYGRTIFREALLYRQVTFSDLHQSKSVPYVHIDLMVPLLSPGRSDSTIIGMFLLRIDPNDVLFPLIQTWPTPSRTSETLLLEQDGDSIVYLNELRHRKNTTLTLRLPISNEQLPASMSVRGIKGVVKGIDYRGVPVLAAIRPIPDSPWYMNAKVDQEEIYAPLRSQAWIVSIGMLLLILSTGSIIGFWWRHQRALFYREKYLAELERQVLVKHFDYIIKYANDIILLINMDGRIVEANDQACRNYGYTREELFRVNIRDLRSPKTRSQVEEEMKQVEERGGLLFETEHVQKDGTVFPVEVSSRFIKIEGVRFYQSIIRDITERKHAEEALRESERRFRVLIENMSDAFSLMDLNGKILYRSPSARQVVDIPDEEIVGSNMFEQIWPEDIDNAKRTFAQILQSPGKRITFQYRVKNKNGSPRWIEGIGNNLLTDPDVHAIVFNYRDITERKQAMEAIQVSEAKIRTMLDSSPNPIIVTDLKGFILECNQATVRLHNYSDKNELIGKNSLELIVPEERSKAIEELNEVFEKGCISNLEYTMVTKDGQTFSGELSIGAVRDFAGNPMSFVTIAQDITERKRAEENLYHANQMLQLVFDNVPQRIFWKDKDLRYLGCNQSFATDAGYHYPSEIIDKDDFAMSWKETAKLYQSDDTMVIETNSAKINYEEPQNRPDGSLLWLRTNKVPLHDQEGQVIGLLGTYEDITERKLAEEAIHKSEERFRNLSDLLPQIVFEMDEKGNLTFVNRQGFKTFGYTEEDFAKGLNAIQIIAPQDRDRALGNMLKRLNGEEIGQQEYFATKKDGSTFPMSLSTIRIMQKNKPIGVSGIAIDITDRKRAEEVLRNSEERFRRLVGSVTDYIYSVKLESGHPVSTSHAPACVSITGYTSEEYTANPDLWYRMIYEEDKQIVTNLTEKLLSGFDVLPLEHRIVHKNGSLRWVKNTPVLKRDDKGILIAYDGLIEDITMQKQGDEALRESEETAHALLNAPNDAAYLLDTNRIIIAMNEAGAHKFGKDVGELIGVCVDDFFPPEIVASRRAFIDQVLRLCKPVHFEDVRFGIHFENSLYPIIDTQGKVIRIAVFSRDITERIRVEEAIQRERNLLRTLIDNLPDAIYVKNIACRKTIANPADVHNMGFQSETEVLGKDDFDVFPKELAEGFFADDQSVILTGKPVLNREEYVLNAEGKKHWLLTAKLPLRNEQGQIIGLVGIGRDITEHLQTEEALRQSESLFKMLVESSPVAIAVFSGPSKKLEYVSDRFAGLFGYDKEDIPSMDAWWQLAYPVEEYRNQIEIKWCETVVEAQREGSVIEPLESVVTCQDGSTKYIESTFTSIGEDTLVFFTDLTQHRLEQEALRQTLTFNELLIQTMPFGMNIVDEEGNILFVSKAMKEMLPVDVVDMCCWKVYKDDNQQCVDCPLRKGITFGKPDVIEATGILGGKIFQISHVGMMYEGKKAMLEVFQDITEQKKLQQELVQSQKLLSIGTMAGGIAHDFNNILAIILGYSSLLHSIKDNPQKFSDGVSAIRQAVDRGAGLVRQILTFARKTDILFEPLSVSELVKELVSMLQQTFPKIITFNTRMEKHLPYINADHTQVHQALLNLCVNARDAMPQGGEISIAIEKVTGEKLRGRFPSATNPWYISLSVSDTGMGMDDAIRNQIFDPFFTTKEKGKGTGLGLSVVYGIVQAHHGFVNVESTLERGTTFLLYFPIPQESSAALESHEQVVAQISGGNETLLLVEDETLLLDMVQIFLESNGYTVFTAKDGEEAVHVYQQHAHEIALVISDMGLPRLTGVSEFEKLKEINPAVKIIFASGYFEPESKAKLENVGAKGFLQKPYVIEEVLLKIRKALDTN